MANAQQLETLNVSYASVTGSRIPLWVAKDAGLFEKYGLNINLVVIAAGNAAIGALSSGDVEILGAPGSTTMVSAAKGLPFAIIGTFGPAAWKLAAHPSITNAEQLRGKTVGISRPGTTIEFATKRALQKLGYTPGKDVNILATGLAESNKRIMVMLQGKMDATLVSPDNLFESEQKGWKLSIIADLKDLGIITSASDLSAKRDFLRNQRQRARAFMMAYCEGIWYGKANKTAALASFRKHMRETDLRRLEALHKNYIVDFLPLKPFPMEDAIQADIENLFTTVPEFRGKKVADFIDKSILVDLDREGFFTQLANKYGKQS
jgi:NitT/TauT family transport system substrate-binding protein